MGTILCFRSGRSFAEFISGGASAGQRGRVRSLLFLTIRYPYAIIRYSRIIEEDPMSESRNKPPHGSIAWAAGRIRRMTERERTLNRLEEEELERLRAS